jgi:predicted solute-binding protein
VRHLAQIAAAEAPVVGLPEQQALSYLRDNLHFELGPREKRGLQLFYTLAHKIGAVSAPQDVSLDGCPVT